MLQAGGLFAWALLSDTIAPGLIVRMCRLCLHSPSPLQHPCRFAVQPLLAGASCRAKACDLVPASVDVALGQVPDLNKTDCAEVM